MHVKNGHRMSLKTTSDITPQTLLDCKSYKGRKLFVHLTQHIETYNNTLCRGTRHTFTTAMM